MLVQVKTLYYFGKPVYCVFRIRYPDEARHGCVFAGPPYGSRVKIWFAQLCSEIIGHLTGKTKIAPYLKGATIENRPLLLLLKPPVERAVSGHSISSFPRTRNAEPSKSTPSGCRSKNFRIRPVISTLISRSTGHPAYQG